MSLRQSEVAELFDRHATSLPRRAGGRAGLPISVFVLLPVAGAFWLTTATDDSDGVATGLIAGVAVLGGLLFQVLAWIGSRIAQLADRAHLGPPNPYAMRLIQRLDIARANIAYAAVVSVMLVTLLAVALSLESRPGWLRFVFTATLFHLCATLILVVFRINRIAADDRVAALTAHLLSDTPESPD